MVFRLLACVALSLVIGYSALAATDDIPPNPKNDPADATTATEAAKADNRVFGGFPKSIYAFPGKECPPDSRPYPGPEQKDLEKMNVIYCVLHHHYAWFYRTPNLDRCPDGKDPVLINKKPENNFTSGRSTTEIIWCEMPNARFLRNGMMAPLRPLKPQEQGKPGPLPPKPDVSAKPTVGTKDLPDLLKGVKNMPPPMAQTPATQSPASSLTPLPAQTVVGTSAPAAVEAPAPKPAEESGLKKFFDFFKGKPSDTPAQ